MNYSTIAKLANKGFTFSPADQGMSYSKTIGWQNIATSDLASIQTWIDEGSNLVSVAKHGHGFAIDIDDIASAKAKGFDLEWLTGYYLVDTPSGGVHAHGLHNRESEQLGNLVVVHKVTGDKSSPKIIEVKLNAQSVAAPTAIRAGQPGKCDGVYQPRTKVPDVIKAGIDDALLTWLKAESMAVAAKVKSSSTAGTVEFHPTFDMADFLEHNQCSERNRYQSDGALCVIVDTCPLCGKDAKNTTALGSVTKFLFSGTGYGFVCHACEVFSRAEFEKEMASNDTEWAPWDEFIYKDDDTVLFAQNPKYQWANFADADADAEAPAGDDKVSEPVNAPNSTIDGYAYSRTDTGNAERLVRNYGKIIRWVAESQEWMVWGKRGWHPDTKSGLMRLTKKIVTELEQEAAVAIAAAGDDKDAQARAKALASFANMSGYIERRRAMVACAAHEVGVTTNFGEWDTDGWALNVQNGIIDLRSQTFRERTQADLCTKQGNIAYDPNAKCPLWEVALAKWMCGDKELIQYVQVALGVTLTSDTSLQVLFFNQGGGNNGKDTMFSTVNHIMGSYWCNVNFTTLAESKYHSEHRNDLAVLSGAVRMVTSNESSDGHTLDEGIVKQITGCSPVTCRHIQGKPFTYIPQYKLWFMSNYEPVIKGNDWGIWRRVKKIPWNYTVTEAEKDSELPSKLQAEAPGILNWMLEGLRVYIAKGNRLPACKAVELATAQYRTDMDIIGRFTRDCIVLDPTHKDTQNLVYRAYVGWCKANGTVSLNSRRFYTEFLKKYPQVTKSDKTMRGIYFQGVNVVCIDGETRLDGTEPFAVGEQEFYDDMTKRAQKYNQ